MFTPFGDERRRKINLGGTPSAVTHAALIDQTRARRTERLEQQRRHDNALRIQAWWRGIKEARRARVAIREAFESDLEGLVGLRCLAVIGRNDEQALAMWSDRMISGGPETLFALARQPHVRPSWLVLVRQIAFLILQSVAQKPQSPHANSHLQVLNTLLSPFSTSQYLGESGVHISVEIAQYLLRRNFYPLLASIMTGFPIEARSSPVVAQAVLLVTAPFQALQPASPAYAAALNATFTSILTIPLLPNRVAAKSLTHLSAHIPFGNLSLLDVDAIMLDTTADEKINLLANLQVFVPPRYKLLDPKSLAIYFRLLTLVINAIPVTILNPPPAGEVPRTWGEEESDEEAEADARPTRVSVVTVFTHPSQAAPPITPPDTRTLKRLTSLANTTHLNALLALPPSPTSRPAFLAVLFALAAVWPGDVTSRVMAASPGLLREIYRGYVRGSGLGRDGAGGANMDGTNPVWPALLLLVELYTKTMLTMGDDEFFGTSSAAAASTSRTLGSAGVGAAIAGAGADGRRTAPLARNPLGLDELVEWSRQLLNVAFTLYWREDPETMRTLVGPEVRSTWEGVRERVTKCLVAIHARDSRKPFMPQGHWLLTSQLDVQSFVDAAIFEERELSISPAGPDAPRHVRMQSKRQLAHLSPRLGVLNNIPFAIPFDVRVSIFRHFVMNDVMARSYASPVAPRFFGGPGRTRVQVRRGHVAQDGFDRLSETDLKAPIEIAFIDQFGAEEAGIDGGGVFKEFFTSLCKEVFDTDRGLWLANKKNELYPNPHAYAIEPHSLNWYRFIGRILGKAMYEGILVDVAFAGFFLAKWLGRQSFLDDLASLDPDLYSGLIFLKHYTGNPEDLALNFTIAIDEFGQTKTVDLIPNGSNITVTRENRLQYIQLVAHYRLTKQIKLQSEAFFEGLSEMIDPKWIRMFNQQEVQVLLGGVNAPIDFDDLRAHTNYGGLYDDHEETIVAFWNVVNTFDQEQRMALLRFVTSCSRPPLLGFKELAPHFSIRDSSSDQDRLPTSSTCVNLLKLPRYKSEKVLREKLLQAINANAGFDLS
ncbi:putative HECT-domain-containing protein [Lyophyllum shimeji]|uniref:HECT-type E3 ubiquitin transferase n=1 Tax=Lyophyllum shimeji TaxID=47721 RepID=A0A9P3UTN6_LYOSH|nr:putative HECT-domain-containing protein [Lyophyllum shimeji]